MPLGACRGPWGSYSSSEGLGPNVRGLLFFGRSQEARKAKEPGNPGRAGRSQEARKAKEPGSQGDPGVHSPGKSQEEPGLASFKGKPRGARPGFL